MAQARALSIADSSTFSEISFPAIKPLSLFEHVSRSPTFKTDEGLHTHLQRFITKQDNVITTYMLACEHHKELRYQLDKKEFKLEEVIKTLRKAEDREEDISLLSDSEKSVKNNTSNFAEIYHPLVIQYYFQIDDMNLLKEKLWNLHAEYNMAQEDQATKYKYEMAVQDSSLLKLLENFAKYEEKILDNLTAVDNNVQ
ncbi:uncharacterized protein CIMG_08407 [Coccidioides immitis RS]|uniref:Uncharacterized protein n=1 Tax=Coccidioides immitis (strain RS) TaxID=246410 RepID=A0A0E1RVE5_COCIM|nr:uncharacterized protein CIMG_08407 [Coccidioides immitis RS]EAS29661.2 hypothetical protein CIMG_08407 [Coccidioides immitis RS]